MKKNILCSLFLLFASSHSWALSEIELTGELDATASVWNLPTGQRGNSAFGVPSLFLNLNAPLKDDNLMVLSFEGSEEKTSSAERFDVKVREAYLDVVSIFQGMYALRFGLIPQTWQEAQYETWTYRFLGQDAWAMTEKWKYQSYSDLGMSFMSELPQDMGEWAFTFSNGEGAEEKEGGPHKEASLFARLTMWAPWTVSLNYVRGNYDKYGEDVGLKERIQAMVTYEKADEWLAGLEYLAAKDPADALRDLKMAEGVDVTALSGEAVSGQAASFFTIIRTGPKAEVMLRYDYLNAVTGEDGKDLQTVIASLGYQVTEDIKAALAVDHTRYGSDFAPGARDRSKVELAAQVLF
ncbi:hypothetical protein [Bdellovibrio sp. HCB-162]|uniref:hypothetical protein n=1 Tax=Bdellovibrio sp. HCB-162 TaxID=3394234 RepID=UPI0039BC67CD